MKTKTALLDKFSAGLVVGIMFALLLAALFDSDVKDGIKNNWVNLATILTAIAAAYFALIGVRRQIEHQDEQAENTRLASLAATKAFLPIVLSDMCRIATAGMRYRWNFHSTITGASDAQIADFRRQSTNELELSDQVISVFRDFIKNADPNDGTRVAMILREYQVLLARWNGQLTSLPSTERPRDRLHETTYWAYLYALTASVFDFARDDACCVDTTVDVDEIRTALTLPVIYCRNTSGFDTEIALYARKFQRQI